MQSRRDQVQAYFFVVGRLVAAVVHGRPDVLITDIRMPDMSGLQLMERLTRTDPDIPVIVITAHDEPGTKERSLALGARHYFCKPIDGAVLMNAIAGAVGKQ